MPIDIKKVRELLAARFRQHPKTWDDTLPELKKNLKEAGFYEMPEGERSIIYSDVKREVRFNPK